jgi:hypothetical protein
MNNTLTLTITSLLSVLLGSFHLSDDIVRGIEPGGTSNFNGVLIMAVQLFATLMLAERRWAHAIVLVMSLGEAAVPYLHMTGVGLVGPRIVKSGAVFFWVWTLMALGVTATVSVVLAARGLWNLQRGRSRRAVESPAG